MADSPKKTPDELLEELGIKEPSQLKIEAIAFHCQAIILYEPLTGCEANIVGKGDRAIITVNSNAIPTRQRFSAGHELGHWMKDRGQSAFGCTDRQIESEWTANNPETRANQFASDLLLPPKLFVPLAKGRPITVETVRDLGQAFQMSLTATGIKLVAAEDFDLLLVDVFMPGMDGLETIKQVHRHKPGLPIIVMSGLSFSSGGAQPPDFLAMACKLGAVGDLKKPFRPRELLAVIAEGLETSAGGRRAAAG